MHSKGLLASFSLFPKIFKETLPNGLTVLVDSNYQAEVVSLQFWCATGSIHEGKYIGSGISHFLEHLLFKGTAQRDGKRIVWDMQALGGHLNAYTSYDRTVYHVDLPSSCWKEALDILSDLVFHAAIPPDSFEEEKEVIRREIAMVEDDPDSCLFQLAFETAFSYHPLKYPIIGLPGLFDLIDRQAVLDYYQSRYVPQNVFLVVSGAVNPEEVYAKATEILSKEPMKFCPLIDIADEPPQLSKRFASKEIATEIGRICMLFHVPGLHHEDAPALQLFSTFLAQTRSSLLHQKLVEKEGIAQEIDAFFLTGSTMGVFGIEAKCIPENVEKLSERILEELRSFPKRGISEEEFTLSLSQQFSHSIRELRSANARAETVGSGWLLFRDPFFKENFLRRLQALEKEKILELIPRYFREENLSQVQLIPKEQKPNVFSSTSKEPTVNHFELSNGIQLIYRSNELPLQYFRATFDGGPLWEPQEKSGISKLAAAILLKGTRKRSAEELAKGIELLGGTYGADSGNNTAGVYLESMSEAWESSFELFSEIIHEPACLERELEIEKRKQIHHIRLQMDDPVHILQSLLRKTLWQGHPYERDPLGTEASIREITVEDIRNFILSVFQTGRMVLGIGGPVAPEKWLKRIESSFVSFPARSIPSSFEFPVFPLEKPLKVEQKIPGKEQAVVGISFRTKPIADPDQIPLEVISEILSDLGSRLFIKIREEKGLAYFVFPTRFIGWKGGAFSIIAGTDPKFKEEVEKLIFNVLEDICQHGFLEEELQRAKAKLLSEEKIASQYPSSSIARATIDALLGLGWDYEEKKIKKIEQISLEEINETARRIFSLTGYVIGIVYP
ncbi:insulinase family protein [Candidatus Methylacidiphilum fumarolicum]|uniref:Coenzyme PQQ synthesis protein F n=2 Tax=Candidatus Methylacidiphilum fumarolicum TaxID=591154 RepID=A0ABM9IB70_9BACT|nr:pitrilysin family protein [Candidatus Methylacidiphilum fumarolicum]MBW6415042.1 insulinase family protein [Candidatus Methylacidiphilum fumarolicum]TFE69724.1 peptidase M16 [Candidatus Methylacidiphilum fumarolicum]TFE74881.1 insulinase family protein [Candidatus Methylacidiphilum fumarolicum]TFE75526.1 insulinase family protein [Candidatus Methylacidiphilum fumarolicum]TFE77964.1 peptidase M16 [Candidatus Methylacidiphilum fumarolicum]